MLYVFLFKMFPLYDFLFFTFLHLGHFESKRNESNFKYINDGNIKLYLSEVEHFQGEIVS